MNVLFLTNRDPFSDDTVGGAETSIRLLADRFAARGHDTVYATKATGWCPSTSQPSLQDNGVKHVTITVPRGSARLVLRTLRKTLLIRELTRLVGRLGTQVAYAYYELENLQTLLRVRSKLGRPRIVLRMAGLRWHRDCLRHPELVAAYQRVFNEVDAINFIHEDLEPMTEQRLAELGMDISFRRRFYGDIGSSVEPGRGPIGRRESDAPFRIVMASRFSDYQKRQELLIEAASLLDPHLRVSMELIGDGANREALQSQIDRLGLREKVSLHAFMPQEALWDRMRGADLMCHACDYEGLGKILVESMAVGLPVLVSNVPPLNSLIVDGENGFLVDNEPAAWARRIEEIAQAHAARELVSRRAIEFVRERYDPNEQVQLYENLFRDLGEG